MSRVAVSHLPEQAIAVRFEINILRVLVNNVVIAHCFRAKVGGDGRVKLKQLVQVYKHTNKFNAARTGESTRPAVISAHTGSLSYIRIKRKSSLIRQWSLKFD